MDDPETKEKMVNRMNHQHAMDRSVKDLERAYLLEVVFEFQASTAARLFATSDIPETFAKFASNMMQALVQ